MPKPVRALQEKQWLPGNTKLAWPNRLNIPCTNAVDDAIQYQKAQNISLPVCVRSVAALSLGTMEKLLVSENDSLIVDHFIPRPLTSKRLK